MIQANSDCSFKVLYSPEIYHNFEFYENFYFVFVSFISGVVFAGLPGNILHVLVNLHS
jgi:hypothetical protein